MKNEEKKKRKEYNIDVNTVTLTMAKTPYFYIKKRLLQSLGFPYRVRVLVNKEKEQVAIIFLNNIDEVQNGDLKVAYKYNKNKEITQSIISCTSVVKAMQDIVPKDSLSVKFYCSLEKVDNHNVLIVDCSIPITKSFKKT